MRRSRRPRPGRGLVTLILLTLTLLGSLLGGVPTPAAAQEFRDPPVPPTALPFGLSQAEKLAQRYAPILYLKQQEHPCDTEGEPYVPAPVDVIFDDEFVVLRRGPDREVVKRGITARDLFWLDSSHHIDLPGRPRVAACTYELHFNQRMVNQQPVVYARIAREEGKRGIALQYWFFYYFNDFNDMHEGDWEMIQLLFDDSNTLTQALLRGPTRVAYAQHSGGETTMWDEARLDKEGGRPVVYVAAGSHASFYGPGIWLGWGKDGAGLGCDVTTGPWDRVTPEVRLIPNEISGPADPYAWTTFRGRWGERDSWVYNGPPGPNLAHSWREPFTWQDQLLAGSIRLQNAGALGPQPTGLFCTIAEGASTLFTLAAPYPWAVGGGLAITFAIAVLFGVVAWPTLRPAWELYRDHLSIFAQIGGILVPFSIAINGALFLLNRDPRIEEFLGLTADSPEVEAGLGIALTVQEIVLLLIVTPAVIHAVGQLRRGVRPTVSGAFRVARWRLPRVIGVHLLSTAIWVLFAITIVGIPLAVVWAVRWLFVVPVVVLEGWSGRWALRASAAAVQGNWWRTLLTNAVLFFIGSSFGPLVGLIVLVGGNVSQDITNGISSVLYAITYPFAIVGVTLLYLELAERAAIVPAAETVTPTPPAPKLAPAPLRPRLLPRPGLLRRSLPRRSVPRRQPET